jgi:predicted PhzF superfamily epimerase YddE/YHI9
MDAEPPAGLADAIGVAPVAFSHSPLHWLAELVDAGTVRTLSRDAARLAALLMTGLIVTAAGDGGDHDYVSRFFAPAVGIPEDPVTGSAHCTLGPYWSARLGRSTLVGYQASARGGHVRTQVCGDRVRLSGQAVMVVSGTLV